MTFAITLAVATFATSLLTFFSGFGLGTLLLPVFALFVAAEVAVAATAVVHAANNLFKVGLLKDHARRDVVLKFGIPAIAASFLGALLLAELAGGVTLFEWELGGRRLEVRPLELVLGLLILGFALFELVPKLRELNAPVAWLPLGGALSGFFGGLSGHQGALRAVFLSPLGLSPGEFAATQAVIAVMVDVVRIVVYGWSLGWLAGAGTEVAVPWVPVGVAVLAALAGAVMGKRLLPKMTVARLHLIVGWLLVVAGLGLATGLA